MGTGRTAGALAALTALAGTLSVGMALAAVVAVAAAGLGGVGAGGTGAAGPALSGTVASGPALSGTVAGGPALATIPPAMLQLYRTAGASVCPVMPWPVLAAIGTVESGNGTSTAPGVRSGTNFAGAEGVMQFEPATFAEYDHPVPPGGMAPPSPYDATDAVFAAARMLCANGAGTGRLAAAVFAYNHSIAYVEEVLALAADYESTMTSSPAVSSGT